MKSETCTLLILTGEIYRQGAKGAKKTFTAEDAGVALRSAEEGPSLQVAFGVRSGSFDGFVQLRPFRFQSCRVSVGGWRRYCARPAYDDP